MPNHSHEIFSHEDRQKFRFWNTAPPDPVAALKKRGQAYHPRNSLGKDQILMPQSPMPIGEHTGKLMSAVPLDYLRWVNDQPWAAQWQHWAPVADYLTRYPLPPWPQGREPGPMIFVTPLEPCTYTKAFPFQRCGYLSSLPESETILHAFAIGALDLRRDWFQPYNNVHPAGTSCYPLNPTRHATAIQAGAQVLDNPQTLADHRRAHHLHAARFQCSQKHCYESQHQADAAAREALNRRRNPPKYLRSYECPYCGLYHLTSKEKRRD